MKYEARITLRLDYEFDGPEDIKRVVELTAASLRKGEYVITDAEVFTTNPDKMSLVELVARVKNK